MKNKGFTMAEVLIASLVALFTFSSTIYTFIMLQKFWRGGNTQIALQSTARIAMEHIIRKVRPALEAQVYNNGNGIALRLDPNGTQTQSDDIWCHYEVSNNRMVYIPNAAAPVPETILENVYQKTGSNIFSTDGSNVVIMFEVRDPSGLFGHKGTYMESAATLRNEE